MQAAYFDQKFHATFFLIDEAPVECGPSVASAKALRTKAKDSAKQTTTKKPVDTLGRRELALVPDQHPFADSDASSDGRHGVGSEVDADQHALLPSQLQLVPHAQDDAAADQLYLLLESQKAAMR